MGTIVNCESRTVEAAYAARLEFDRDVHAYYEQPPMVECARHAKSGRARRVAYYPDFLVLKRDEAVVLQTKDDAHLQKKCADIPMDWVCQPDGEYVDMPASAAFEAIGLRHVVVSDAQLPKIETANLKTLLRVRERATAIPQGVRRACAAFTSRNGVVSLQQLLQELGSDNTEPVYALLVDDSLHTDLTRTLLTQAESCLISSDRQLLREEIYELWFARHCPKSIVSTSDPSASAPQQRVPCEKHLLRALRNMRRLKSGEHSRSARRWRHRLRSMRKKGISEIEALVPAWRQSGNTDRKRHPEVLSFCDEYIQVGWQTLGNNVCTAGVVAWDDGCRFLHHAHADNCWMAAGCQHRHIDGKPRRVIDTGEVKSAAVSLCYDSATPP